MEKDNPALVPKVITSDDINQLTVEDLELLHTFLYAVKNNKQGVFTFTRLSDEQYEEVLRRFREAKK